MGVQAAESYSLPPPFPGEILTLFCGHDKNGGPQNSAFKDDFSCNTVPRGVAVKGSEAHWELKSSEDGMMHTIFFRYSFCDFVPKAGQPLSSPQGTQNSKVAILCHALVKKEKLQRK